MINLEEIRAEVERLKDMLGLLAKAISQAEEAHRQLRNVATKIDIYTRREGWGLSNSGKNMAVLDANPKPKYGNGIRLNSGESKVLLTLGRGPASMARLSEFTELSPSTLRTYLPRLMRAGKITKSGKYYSLK